MFIRCYILFLLFPLFGCADGTPFSGDDSNSSKTSSDERTSDSSEGVPGYLAGLAFVSFDIEDNFLTIKGKENSVLGGTSELNELYINVLEISQGQIDDAIDEENNSANTKDEEENLVSESGGDNKSLVGDGAGLNFALKKGSAKQLVGVLVASVQPRQSGSFYIRFRKDNSNPIVVTVSAHEENSFVIISSKNTEVISSIFYDVTGQVEAAVLSAGTLERIKEADPQFSGEPAVLSNQTSLSPTTESPSITGNNQTTENPSNN